MALVKCQECGKEISSGATSCPQCGYGLARDRAKRRSDAWAFRIGFGVFLLFAGLVVLYLISGNTMEERTKEFRAACDPLKADGLVQQMMKEGFFYKIDAGGNFPRIYVKENWYLVTIDGKGTFDEILQCHFTRGIGNPMLGIYRDYRSGKEVATTGGVSGFAMK